ncbi:MAG: hypothetical protein WAU65_00015 [Candidatus Nanoarchaeia archaeon]
MVVDTILAGLIGLIGIIIGSIITILGSRHIAKKNHEYSIEKLGKEQEYKLKYLREEIFYRKKIDFFQKIMEELSNYLKQYATIDLFLTEENFKQVMKIYGVTNTNDFNKTKKEKLKEVINNIGEKSKLFKLDPKGDILFLEDGQTPAELQKFIINHTNIFARLVELFKSKKEDKKKIEELKPFVKQGIMICNNLLELMKNEINP